MEVIWKSIVGYEGMYEVSNDGQVRSLDRLVYHPIVNTRIYPGRVLKQMTNRYGYKVVMLSKDNKQKIMPIHRLVATAFIPNPKGLPVINHKNEIRSDNRLENLEWCDWYYNVNYGHCPEKIREKVRKRAVFQIGENGEVIRRWKSINEAAISVGTCAPNIRKVCIGERNYAGGFKWKYE